MLTHYIELIDFANEAFSRDQKADFISIQPKIYKHLDDYYVHHYVRKKDGIISGIIGMYPVSFNDVKALSLGTICVHQQYRNQGIMQQMFKDISSKFRQYDLIFLNGDKHLYEQYGFYKSSRYYKFRFKSNIAKFNVFEHINISLYTHDETKRTMKLHADYTFYSDGPKRSKKHYFDILKTNRFDIYLIEDEGYIVYNSKKKTIMEIIADPQRIKDVLCSFVQILSLDEVYYEVSMKSPHVPMLHELSEDSSTHTLMNIRISNYVHLISKMLTNKKNIIPGTLIIKIESKMTLKIEVENQVIVKEIISDDYDLLLTEKEMTSLLFDDYGLIRDENTDKKEILKSWFPFHLPVTLHSIDGI